MTPLAPSPAEIAMPEGNSPKLVKSREMSTAPDELNELREHAEEAERNRSLAPVSLTMAVLAVLLAAATLMSHRSHTEEILLQNRATDQWSYYQAKNVRRATMEEIVDLLGVASVRDPEAAAQLKEKYTKNIERYRDEQTEIQAEAKKLEDERTKLSNRADRFDLGEGFLEVAIVITSITLLTRRRMFWFFGSMIGVLGIIVAATAFTIH
jgi:cell division protein FtsB